MSILVKGMEMPKDCESCLLSVRDPLGGFSRFCKMTKHKVAETKRADDCPLVGLPPHGRLIDADALKETLDYYIREAGWSSEINEALTWVRDEFIDHEPTIIPEEK